MTQARQRRVSRYSLAQKSGQFREKMQVFGKKLRFSVSFLPFLPRTADISGTKFEINLHKY
jgi:hypothetical protein